VCAVIHRSRRGVTLVELLVALVLGSAVAGAALALLRHQLRLATHIMSHRIAEAAVDDALHLLRADVRSVHPIADSAVGILDIADSVADLWALRGTAIVCDTQPFSRVVVVDAHSTDLRHARWAAAPRIGDRVAFLVASSVDTPAADEWRIADIDAAATPTTCPALNGQPRAAGRRWSLTGARPPIGALLRITRRTQYKLYRSGDGAWALGVSEWNGQRWSTIQPVVAPLARAGRASGLVMQSIDTIGRDLAWPVATGTVVGALRFTARGATWTGTPVDSFTLLTTAGRP
jgi:prepilin-type N-terminal cleavage/methylation domain-containing protein